MLNIPVVINAGGKGTRLDPFTKVLPKPLIPVGDIPIIEHIMKEYQFNSLLLLTRNKIPLAFLSICCIASDTVNVSLPINC